MMIKAEHHSIEMLATRSFKIDNTMKSRSCRFARIGPGRLLLRSILSRDCCLEWLFPELAANIISSIQSRSFESEFVENRRNR